MPKMRYQCLLFVQTEIEITKNDDLERNNLRENAFNEDIFFSLGDGMLNISS